MRADRAPLLSGLEEAAAAAAAAAPAALFFLAPALALAAAALSADASSASGTPLASLGRCRSIAPNPPKDSGDAPPAASPACRIRSVEGSSGARA